MIISTFYFIELINIILIWNNWVCKESKSKKEQNLEMLEKKDLNEIKINL